MYEHDEKEENQMSRAERRRAEREAKKGTKAVEQRISGFEESVRIAVLKENITRDVDRKLYDKYYRKANKDAVDNIYKIVLTSFGLALADTCPSWGSVAIAKRIQKTMDYVDKFTREYDGDINRFMKELEERTGFSFDVDSVSREDE